MKKGFLITNGLALFFAIISIGWLIYDYIALDILYRKMSVFEPLSSVDLKIANFIWLGIVVFLLSHILAYIAIATQFQIFRKASVLRIASLLLGIFSCVMIFADFACLVDLYNEYEAGRVAMEWKLLNGIIVIRGIIFFAIIANLIEALFQHHKIRTEELPVKDEVLLILIH